MAFLDKTGLERLWSHIASNLGNKVDKVNGKDLSTNDYTTEEKNKLAGIATGATKVTVDSALSSSSTNPVQNKVVNTALTNLNTLVGDTAVATQVSNYAAPKSHTHNYYVKGTQTASTNAFTGVLNEVSALYEGLTINYWLPYIGTSAKDTLNLTLKDGSTTGDIPIYYTGTSRLTTQVGANNIISLVYQTVTISGTSYTGWWLNKTQDSDTYDKTRYAGAKVIAGTNGIYGNNLIALDSNDKWQGFVKSRTTATTKTINTDAKFKFPMNILYYYSSANVVSDATVSSASYLYTIYPTLDVRFSHNYTTTFTINSPVYLEGTIDDDGYFSVTSTCITQTFTSGKYYVFLGMAGSSADYQLQLHSEHPAYYYDGTNLVDYTKKLYGNTLSASGKTVELKNGLGETLSSITTQDTTYSNATTSAAGLMSASDKTALDNLGTLVGDTAVSTQISEAISDKANTNHTHNVVTTIANGFMSSTDKIKLDASMDAVDFIVHATGETIAISGATDESLLGLTVYGKSTQDGIPTTETPLTVNHASNPTISITDGAVTQTITVPYELRGIPVVNDGNYVDGNGQKWVTDEVDFKRGKFIKRVNHREFNGTEDWSSYGVTTGTYKSYVGYYSKIRNTLDKNAITTHYQVDGTYTNYYYGRSKGAYVGTINNSMGVIMIGGDYATKAELQAYLKAQYDAGNPLIVYYALKTPEETDLTAEELEAYAALYGMSPMTVSNDVGVGVQVSCHVNKELCDFSTGVYEAFIPTMVGSTNETDGMAGLVPQPVAGQSNSFLRSDGTWATVALPVVSATEPSSPTAGMLWFDIS